MHHSLTQRHKRIIFVFKLIIANKTTLVNKLFIRLVSFLRKSFILQRQFHFNFFCRQNENIFKMK